MQTPSPWLHRYSQLVVAATVGLIFVGGMVTSKNAGLAVPDWPTSYGYNMFTFPVSRWIGGIFWEHAHRLVASTIGLLTIGLTVWIWKSDRRAWVRGLGLGALVLVVLQGVLGGLRVTKLSIGLAMIHGCAAQAFLCVLIVLAAALSPRWIEGAWKFSGRNLAAIRWLSWLMVAAVYCQLILGAVMRHMKAGLAIQDFPWAFGKLIPPVWTPSIAIHYSHRLGAVCVSLIMLTLVAVVLVSALHQQELRRPALWLLQLVALQIVLGANIIWLAKEPVVTTLHVVNGAAILGTSLLLALRASRFVSMPRRVEASCATHSMREARA